MLELKEESATSLRRASCDVTKPPPMLWIARNAAGATAYLVGTIQVNVNLLQPLPPVLMQVLNLTYLGGVFVEVTNAEMAKVQSPAGQARMGGCMKYQTGGVGGGIIGAQQTMRGRLPPAAFAKLVKVSHNIIANISASNPMRSQLEGMLRLIEAGDTRVPLAVVPWIMALEQASLNQESLVPFDTYLQGHTSHTTGFETADFQLQILCELYQGSQIVAQEVEYINGFAESYDADISDIHQLVDAWRCGSVEEIASHMNDGSTQVENVTWFNDLMLTKRNEKFANGIVSALKHTPTPTSTPPSPILVAVGSMHFAYDTPECPSVLRLLEKAGLDVTRVLNRQRLAAPSSENEGTGPCEGEGEGEGEGMG